MSISFCEPSNSRGAEPLGRIVVRGETVGPDEGRSRRMAQADVDRVERRDLARTTGGRLTTDAGGVVTLAAPATALARAVVRPDLSAAADAKRPWWSRLGRAILLGGGLVGGPDAAALKALGLRAVESAATHTVYAAAERAGADGVRAAGKLIVPLGAGKMSEAERSAAAYLVRSGHEVVRVPESTIDGSRSADFLIDGKRTELKTLSNVRSPDFTGAVIRRIREAAAQAPNVLIDARGQAGMDEEAAQQILAIVYKSARDRGIAELRIIGKGFDDRMVR